MLKIKLELEYLTHQNEKSNNQLQKTYILLCYTFLTDIQDSHHTSSKLLKKYWVCANVLFVLGDGDFQLK